MNWQSARTTMEEELATAQAMGYCYGAKIVRGAYMDQERTLAKQHHYEGEKKIDVCLSVCLYVCMYVRMHAYTCMWCSSHGFYPTDPVHPTKAETNSSYHDVVCLALGEAKEGRALITVATHNPDSVQMAQMM